MDKYESKHAKYLKDIERCRRLEESLSERIRRMPISRKQLASRFAEITGLAESTAYNFINNLRPQSISSAVESPYQITLERLAVYYSLLDIKPNDPLVQLAREINPIFEYTPKDKPPQEPKAVVQVKFSGKGMHITPEQKADLEKLAIQYALANKQTSK